MMSKVLAAYGGASAALMAQAAPSSPPEWIPFGLLGTGGAVIGFLYRQSRADLATFNDMRRQADEAKEARISELMAIVRDRDAEIRSLYSTLLAQDGPEALAEIRNILASLSAKLERQPTEDR